MTERKYKKSSPLSPQEIDSTSELRFVFITRRTALLRAAVCARAARETRGRNKTAVLCCAWHSVTPKRARTRAGFCCVRILLLFLIALAGAYARALRASAPLRRRARERKTNILSAEAAS